MLGWYWLFVVLPISAILALVWSALRAHRAEKRLKRQAGLRARITGKFDEL